MSNTIVLSIKEHQGTERLFADFPYDRDLVQTIREVPGAKWSQSNGQWHMDFNKPTYELLKEKIKDKALLDETLLKQQLAERKTKQETIKNTQPQNNTTTESYPILAVQKYAPINEVQQVAVQAYIELLRLKNYSDNTLKNYKSWFVFFLNHFPHHKPSTITKNEIMDFLVAFRNSKSWSSTTQNQIINAIKFFYEQVLKQPRTVYDLPRAQKPQQLPSVFAESEVLAIINASENVKHKTMLCLAYAGGLRVSEIVNLKLKDVDSKRMVITLRQAKGKKDRQVMLSEKLLVLLRNYFKEYQPKEWMFEGQKGEQYSTRSVQEVIQQAKEKAGIKKKGSIHALRHSFATHLFESGTDIASIKELLGHSSIRTTLIYTHVSKKQLSKIQSPLDKLL